MSTPWIKPASFAGRFYPASKRALEKDLEEYEALAQVDFEKPQGQLVGIVSPHAGYIFSGPTAALSFHAARESQPETVIVLGLSHRSRLEGISILTAEACETPLGLVNCDLEFAEALLKKIPFAVFRREAHLSEHSVETQLPFIRRTFPEACVVEILTQDDSPPIPELTGQAIAAVAGELGRRILIVASTDLSHYPPQDFAEKVDQESLQWMLTLDPSGAEQGINQIEARGGPDLHCAVCSKAALFTGMHAAIGLGARKGNLLGYTNSGMGPHGEPGRVVGYGAVAWTGD
jgi:MEMO1 family protein